MSATKFLLTLLFLPVLVVFLLGWWIYWKFWGKKQAVQKQKHKKQTKKLLTHIYNFSPVRLKNRTWRKSLGKVKKKRKKKDKNTYYGKRSKIRKSSPRTRRL